MTIAPPSSPTPKRHHPRSYDNASWNTGFYVTHHTVMSRTTICHVTHYNLSCHAPHSVVSRTTICRVTHDDMSFHAPQSVMSRTTICHVAHYSLMSRTTVCCVAYYNLFCHALQSATSLLRRQHRHPQIAGRHAVLSAVTSS